MAYRRKVKSGRDERAEIHMHTEELLSVCYPVVESNRKARNKFTFSPPASQM